MGVTFLWASNTSQRTRWDIYAIACMHSLIQPLFVSSELRVEYSKWIETLHLSISLHHPPFFHQSKRGRGRPSLSKAKFDLWRWDRLFCCPRFTKYWTCCSKPRNLLASCSSSNEGLLFNIADMRGNSPDLSVVSCFFNVGGRGGRWWEGGFTDSFGRYLVLSNCWFDKESFKSRSSLVRLGLLEEAQCTAWKVAAADVMRRALMTCILFESRSDGCFDC